MDHKNYHRIRAPEGLNGEEIKNFAKSVREKFAGAGGHDGGAVMVRMTPDTTFAQGDVYCCRVKGEMTDGQQQILQRHKL